MLHLGERESQGVVARETVVWRLFTHLVNMEEKRKSVFISRNYAFCSIHFQKQIALVTCIFLPGCPALQEAGHGSG